MPCAPTSPGISQCRGNDDVAISCAWQRRPCGCASKAACMGEGEGDRSPYGSPEDSNGTVCRATHACCSATYAALGFPREGTAQLLAHMPLLILPAVVHFKTSSVHHGTLSANINLLPFSFYSSLPGCVCHLISSIVASLSETYCVVSRFPCSVSSSIYPLLLLAQSSATTLSAVLVYIHLHHAGAIITGLRTGFRSPLWSGNRLGRQG